MVSVDEEVVLLLECVEELLCLLELLPLEGLVLELLPECLELI